MFFDFTYAAFDHFCAQSAHMPVFALSDYLSRTTLPPLPYLILRIDVGHMHALDLARIASWHSLRASFYFQDASPDAMHAVSALGHEVMTEAPAGINFAQLTYLSDIGGYWHLYDFYQPRQRGRRTSLRAVLRDSFHPHSALYVHFHTDYWFPHPWNLFSFRLRRLRQFRQLQAD